MAAELETNLDETAQLIQGSGGIFEVEREGRLIYSKRATGRFPEDGEVVAIVKAVQQGTPLEQAQQDAAANAQSKGIPSFGEWLGSFFKRS